MYSFFDVRYDIYKIKITQNFMKYYSMKEQIENVCTHAHLANIMLFFKRSIYLSSI